MGVSFGRDSSGLHSERAYKFKVFKGAPIFHAARLRNLLVIDRLREYGANTAKTATEYVFKQEITGVSRDYVVHHDGPRCHHHPYGIGYNPYGHTVLQFNNTRIEQRIRINTAISRKNQTFWKLNNALQLVQA